MFTFILLLILALAFGYFATQNTLSIPITLANYKLPNVPLYIVIGVTLLLGLSFSWLMSLLNSFSTAMKLRGKDNTIKGSEKTINDLTKQVNQLEIENARLKGKKESEEHESL